MYITYGPCPAAGPRGGNGRPPVQSADGADLVHAWGGDSCSYRKQIQVSVLNSLFSFKFPFRIKKKYFTKFC
jgi:hypothetical protein